MIAFTISPGEGLPLDFTYPDNASGYAFSAVALNLSTGVPLPLGEDTTGALEVASLNANTWRANLTGEQSAAWKGRRFLVRATAIDSATPTLPLVDDVEVAVRAV